MVQLAPASLGNAFGHNSYVPNMKYAYDVSLRNGLVSATVKINDIDGTPIKGHVMGQTRICPVETGALVISATGGAIKGYDMYGQYVQETVAAAGTTKIAFAQITSAPADAQWVNKFGLPYKYLSAATPAMTVATITVPAADGDSRGTFVAATPPTGPTTLQLTYIADQTNLMGDAYGTRFDTAEPGSVALAVTATINPTTGACVVTVPVSTPAGVKTTVTFPDGHTVRGTAGTVVNHTLSPIWMSQYADVISSAAADKLIAVGFDGSFIDGLYANVTGLPALMMAMAATQAEAAPEAPSTALRAAPDAAPDAVAEPATFKSHAEIDAYVQEHKVEVPDDWNTLTLAAKRQIVDRA